MWGAAGNHNYICHICAKGSLNLNFDQTVIDKISNFPKNCPKFSHIYKILILKLSLEKIYQLLLPYKFYGWDI